MKVAIFPIVNSISAAANQYGQQDASPTFMQQPYSSCGKTFLVVVWNTIPFLPHPAGSKATSQVGPKIVLDHVRVYV